MLCLVSATVLSLGLYSQNEANLFSSASRETATERCQAA